MTTLERILVDVYGINILDASPTTILVATDYIEDLAKVTNELEIINTMRDRAGQSVVCVPVGHRLFSTNTS